MRRAKSLDPSILGIPGHERDPLDELVRLEVEQVVRDQLSKLPTHEREALLARTRYTDQSCRSIAANYGVSAQTICNWAEAAERKLRPVLEGLCQT